MAVHAVFPVVALLPASILVYGNHYSISLVILDVALVPGLGVLERSLVGGTFALEADLVCFVVLHKAMRYDHERHKYWVLKNKAVCVGRALRDVVLGLLVVRWTYHVLFL